MPETRCLVLLQNAWSPLYAGGIWPRESWLRALHSCPTGRALKIVFPDQTGIEFDNTTAEVSEEPEGVCKPDPVHIANTIGRCMPGFILACGKQAKEAVQELWPGRLVCIPHPAYRLTQRHHLELVRDYLNHDQFRRTEIKYKPGAINVYALPEVKSKQIHLF